MRLGAVQRRDAGCYAEEVREQELLQRLIRAFRAFFSILLGREPAVEPPAATPAEPRVPPPPAAPASAGAVQMLAVLQREARLVDFLMEDISSYSDQQIGAAVRSLHEACRQTLARYVRLEPVIDGVEGSFTRVSADMARSAAVKFVGRTPAEGVPDGGILRHRGWRAAGIQLPALETGEDFSVVAPAEIEVD